MQIQVKGVIKSAFKPEDSDRCFVKMLVLESLGDFKFSMEQSPPPADLVGTKVSVIASGNFEGADRGQRGFSLHADGAVTFTPEGGPVSGGPVSGGPISGKTKS